MYCETFINHDTDNKIIGTYSNNTYTVHVHVLVELLYYCSIDEVCNIYIYTQSFFVKLVAGEIRNIEQPFHSPDCREFA